MTIQTTFHKFFKGFVFALTLGTLIVFWSSCKDDDENPCKNSDLAVTVDGTALKYEATASGGTSPYTYQLDEGTFSSSSSFTVTEGDHTVTVMDSKGCTASTTIEGADACEDFAVSATADTYDVDITITNGTAPFDYKFAITSSSTIIAQGTMSSSSETVELDTAAAMTLTITDDNGCEINTTLTADDISLFTDPSDGQTYQTVKIGDQIWFAENYNLNTNTADSTSSWYYDDDSTSYAADYGKLYTWYVATEIAPEGWSLPSNSDFETLISTIGGIDEGTKLLVNGETGFNIRLGGAHTESSGFVLFDDYVFLWMNQTSNTDASKGLGYQMNSAGEMNDFYNIKTNAFTLRFIKN